MLHLNRCSLHCQWWYSPMCTITSECFYFPSFMMQKKETLVSSTFTGFLVEIVATWTHTPVRANQIHTCSCTTCAWIHCTFINIWEKKGIYKGHTVKHSYYTLNITKLNLAVPYLHTVCHLERAHSRHRTRRGRCQWCSHTARADKGPSALNTHQYLINAQTSQYITLRQ